MQVEVGLLQTFTTEAAVARNPIGQFVAYRVRYPDPCRLSGPEPFRVGKIVGVLADGFVTVRHYYSAYRKKGARWRENLRAAKFFVWHPPLEQELFTVHRLAIVDTFDALTQGSRLPAKTCQRLEGWMEVYKHYEREAEGGESREVEVQDRASWIFGCLGEVQELVRGEVDKLTTMPFPAPIQDIIVSCIVNPYRWRSEHAEGSQAKH